MPNHVDEDDVGDRHRGAAASDSRRRESALAHTWLYAEVKPFDRVASRGMLLSILLVPQSLATTCAGDLMRNGTTRAWFCGASLLDDVQIKGCASADRIVDACCVLSPV